MHAPRQFTTPAARRAAIEAGELVISGAEDAPEGEQPPAAEAAPTEPETTEAPAGASAESEAAPTEAATEPPAEAAPTEPAEASIAVPDVPEDLGAADEDALRALHGELVALIAEHAPTITTAAELEVLEGARASRDAIAAEVQRRVEEATRVLAGRDELAAEAAALPEPVVVQASAAAIVRNRTPQAPGVATAPAQAATVPRPRVAMQAAAGLSTRQIGQEVTLLDIGQALDDYKNMEVASGQGPNGGAKMTKVRLASIAGYTDMAPEDRALLPEPLSRSNTVRNDELIAEAQADWHARQAAAAGSEPDYAGSRQAAANPARQAAVNGALVTGAELATADTGGAPCLPFDIIREIPDEFSATEVISPIWPSRAMSRLGFMFTPSGVLADVEDGVGNWFDEDQQAVDVDDSSTWKPIVDLVCPDAFLMRAEWVVAGVRFDNVLEMSNPERIANMMSALNAVFARTKEARLLQIVDSLTSQYNFVGVYGALPTFITAINTLVAQAVEDQRLTEPNFVMILPKGVEAQLVIDRANRAFGTEMNSAELLNELRSSLDGVTSIVEPLDWSRGGEPGHPFTPINPVGHAPIDIPMLDNDYRVRLVSPGSAIYSEVGAVNTGVMRSPDLMRMNKAVTFREEGFALAKNGPNHWFSINVGLCADGSRADLRNPDGWECGNVS